MATRSFANTFATNPSITRSSRSRPTSSIKAMSMAIPRASNSMAWNFEASKICLIFIEPEIPSTSCAAPLRFLRIPATAFFTITRDQALATGGRASWCSNPKSGIPTSIMSPAGRRSRAKEPTPWLPTPRLPDGSQGAVTGDNAALELVVYMGRPGLPDPVTQPGTFSMQTHTRDYGRGGGSWPFHSSENFFDPLDDKNTLITFSNHPGLYREPTLLIKPNVPTDSHLTAPGLQKIAGLSAFTDASGACASMPLSRPTTPPRGLINRCPIF